MKTKRYALAEEGSDIARQLDIEACEVVFPGTPNDDLAQRHGALVHVCSIRASASRRSPRRA